MIISLTQNNPKQPKTTYRLNWVIFSSMDKDTLIAASNILTPVSVGFAVMNPVTYLTILSISTSIILNGILIYKNLNKKEKN